MPVTEIAAKIKIPQEEMLDLYRRTVTRQNLRLHSFRALQEKSADSSKRGKLVPCHGNDTNPCR